MLALDVANILTSLSSIASPFLRRWPIRNTNRTSGPDCLLKQWAPQTGSVMRVHGIRLPCARSSKRAGGLIPRIAPRSVPGSGALPNARTNFRLHSSKHGIESFCVGNAARPQKNSSLRVRNSHSSVKHFLNLRLHRFIHLDERPPGAFNTFAIQVHTIREVCPSSVRLPAMACIVRSTPPRRKRALTHPTG